MNSDPESAFAVEPPPMLYKFRPINPFTLRMLTVREFYFSRPIEDFNDPFDCRLPESFEGSSYTDWLERAKRASLRLGTPFNEADAKVRAIKFAAMQKMGGPEWQHQLRQFATDLVGGVGVLSLTETYEDSLMWSHYADGHKGICIGFDIREEPTLFYNQASFLGRVAYPIKYDPPNFFEDAQKKHIQWRVFTKLPHWSYEREWRVVRYTGFGPSTFPHKILRRMIFGVSMPHADKILVSKLLANWVPQPELLQAFTVENRLGFHPVPPHIFQWG